MDAYIYILKCANGAYYTGSTKDLDKRLIEHQDEIGASFTRKHAPFTLVYLEHFNRIDEAFRREKQIRAWNRKKKEALINGFEDQLLLLSKART